MPHPNTELLTRFYTAFAALDDATMATCYAPEVQFEDEAFKLAGRDEVTAMWAMLCSSIRESGRDAWSLQFSDIDADDHQGRAHWEPRYRFSATGRNVHNIIDVKFTFRDGLIATQRDSFDFWSWSRQALGAPGLLLGWSAFLRGKVRSQAAANLAKFRERARAGRGAS